MPELPEVETVRRVLEPQLMGRQIAGVQLVTPQVIAFPKPEHFSETVCGKTIVGIERRGKFLQMILETGEHIVVHFRMTGCLLLSDADYPEEKHTHVVFVLDNGQVLRYSDQRRFGKFWMIADVSEIAVTGMDRLGLEPFDEGVTAAYLRERLGSRRISIKEGLLEQSVIAGIGNIYSDEILFACKIYPGQAANTLTPAQWRRLAEQIPKTMEYYIETNAISPEDYLKGKGKDYRNTPYLKVYGHKGEPCPQCGTTLARTVIGGRSSVYCAKCQKMRKRSKRQGTAPAD